MLARTRPLGSLLYLAIGIGSALVGLLPWIVTGMRLPLQNLWATGTLPAQMPIALLPFSQYYLSTMVALLLIGSTIAGIVGRATTARHPGRALGALIGGVLLVQVGALIQAVIVVSRGLSDRSESAVYLAAIVSGLIVAILFGVGMLALIARAPKAGAVVALSIAAVAFSSWFGALAFPIGTVASYSPYTDAMGEIARFSPAVIVGAAIAWGGVTTVGRAAAAVASLGLLWVGPTLVTAVSSATGSRVLLRDPAGMLDYGLNVFRSALGMPELSAPVVGLGLAVAVVGLVGRRTVSSQSAD